MAIAVAIRLTLDPLLGDRVMLIVFVPAILAAAATGGLAPGLTATLLSVAASIGLLFRYGAIPANDIDAAFLAALGIAISFGGQWARGAQANAAGLTRRIFERQAQLQSILDTVPDAMIVIDEKGIVQSFGPAAEQLFQWTKDEVTGRNVNGSSSTNS